MLRKNTKCTTKVIKREEDRFLVELLHLNEFEIVPQIKLFEININTIKTLTERTVVKSSPIAEFIKLDDNVTYLINQFTSAVPLKTAPPNLEKYQKK